MRCCRSTRSWRECTSKREREGQWERGRERKRKRVAMITDRTECKVNASRVNGNELKRLKWKRFYEKRCHFFSPSLQEERERECWCEEVLESADTFTLAPTAVREKNIDFSSFLCVRRVHLWPAQITRQESSWRRRGGGGGCQVPMVEAAGGADCTFKYKCAITLDTHSIHETSLITECVILFSLSFLWIRNLLQNNVNSVSEWLKERCRVDTGLKRNRIKFPLSPSRCLSVSADFSLLRLSLVSYYYVSLCFRWGRERRVRSWHHEWKDEARDRPLASLMESILPLPHSSSPHIRCNVNV